MMTICYTSCSILKLILHNATFGACNLKDIVKIILKFIFSGGIIYWLISTGKLDFTLAFKVLEHKISLVLCLVFLVIQAILASIRWRILLRRGTNAPLPHASILGMTWIGLFFSSILPGAVTGDLIKLVYARDLDKNISKTFLVMTVVMDRVLGLIGLLFLLGIFSLVHYSYLSKISSNLTHLINFNFLLFLGALLFLVSLFLHKKIQKKISSLVIKIPLIGQKLTKTFEQVWLIGESKTCVMNCLLLSFLSHSLNILAFYTISSPFYDIPLSLGHAFTFMPLGLMAIAVPISPAGLGVGHAVFNTLFSYYGVSNGASLFNLHFLAYVSINLFGIIPYLTMGKRHHLEEARELY